MLDRTVYLIRHAAPLMGTGLQYDVPPGPSLSADGRREARAVAEFLAERGIERVVHSPLDRTALTATILGARLDVPVVVETGLAEHRRGEAAADVRARVVEAFERAVAGPHAIQAIVSHGSPLKLLLEHLTQGRVTFAGLTFPGGNVIPTGGVWQVRGQIDGAWEALFVFQPSVMPSGETPAWAAGGVVV